MGLSRFLTKVYNWTGLSIGGALLTSQIVLATCSPASFGAVSIGGLVMGLGGLIGASMMKAEPYTAVINVDGKQAQTYATRNSTTRQLLFGAGIIGIGASTAPLIAMASAINPSVLPMSIGLSMAIFGGASMAAYQMPKDQMLSYRRPLMGSLIGLIVLQLTGFLATAVVGPNPFSMMVTRVDAYVAVALFTALTAYDTQVAIRSYEDGLADHLGISIQLFLDFWNLFQSLLRIFSRD